MPHRHKKSSFEFDLSKILKSRDPKFKVIFPKGNDKTVDISLAKIKYAEANGEICCLHTTDPKSPKESITQSLRETESQLKPYGFFRNHRSYLINLSFLSAKNKELDKTIELSDGAELPLSRRRKLPLIELLEKIGW